jgi:L-cysteine S-thiosulfotransferase
MFTAMADFRTGICAAHNRHDGARRRGDLATAPLRHRPHPYSPRRAAAARLAPVAATLIALVALPLSDAWCVAAPPSPAAVTATFVIVGDGIPAALGGAAGDPARGRALVVARDAANCILCHAVNDPGVRFSGNVGPALDGVGRRMSVAQLRLRVVDSARVNADTIMPGYYRVDASSDVAAAYRGKPILDAQQVEDIVAWLAALR